jgi:hypothetical protein
VLLAAPKVGSTGKAIGIDMTPAMIERARASAIKMGATNTEFHLAAIDNLPLADRSVDCIVSNCVINLAPDKSAVVREMFRVLKPGGRVAVSDIALKRPLPDELAKSVAAYVGCVAGAIPISDYERILLNAGFASVQVVDTRKDLNAYSKVENQSGCCSPAMEESSACCAEAASQSSSCCTPAPSGSSACCAESERSVSVTDEEWIASSQSCCGVTADEKDVHSGLAELIAKYDVNDYAASVQIYAVKP